MLPSAEVSRIENDLLRFICNELVEGDVAASHLLGPVLRGSSIGYQGAGVALMAYVSQTYDLPVEKLRAVNTDEMTISRAAREIYHVQQQRRVA